MTNATLPGNSTSRPAIERMQRLANLLRHNLQFTAGEMARELETSRKTIVRDLDFMRDRLGWEFAYDHKAGKYRCTKAPTPTL